MFQEEMTVQEAVKAFAREGITLSEATFRRRARKEKISSHVPEGKQRGALYRADEVRAFIARERAALIDKGWKPTVAHTPGLQPASFHKVTPEDMPKLASIIESIFGSHPDVERWANWIRKNPDIGYMLKSENEIVGCGFIIPLFQEKILDILSKEVTPPTLPEEIQDYIPEVPIYLYTRTIGVLQDKGISMSQRRLWASILVRNLTNVIIELGSRGIVIEKIYGRSDSSEGTRLMRDMGFTQLRTTTSHNNFVIDVKTSGLEMILRYEQALNRWRQRYAGE